jgi:radical SAM protein with 4Fe4S-binding SPASM domain
MGHQHGVTHAFLEDGPYDDFFREHNHTRVPVLVQWMVTLDCPLSCPHCLCGGARSGDALTIAEAGTLLDEIASLGVRELLLTGGEPLARADLPRILDMMRERSIRWSLNTAVRPGPAALRAMTLHPPSFVAVSLDGPEPFHDRFRGRAGAFRESLEALAIYSDLTAGHAAAGTTVNALNFPLLEQTLAIVMRSRASSWGLHLTFPEGRARRARELFLTRRQLRRLLSFVEAKRRVFPVVLADEIGFCGEWEPAVRQAPFFCGAGRAQCVVLADGEVVPCSTVDARESAGNVRERPLADIWRDGFARIRDFVPMGKCRGCEYLPACSGGCWLMRRHGTHCHRDVWGSWKRIAAPAGIAACLAACGGPPADVKEPPVEPASVVVESPQPPASTAPDALTKSEALEIATIDFIWRKMCHTHSSTGLTAEEWSLLEEDPAGRYLGMLDGTSYPDSIEERVALVMEALETGYRSLAFLSLLWSHVTLTSLQGPAPGDRTAEQSQLIQDAIEAIAAKAQLWRKEIYTLQLDGFVAAGPGGRHHFFMMSKAVMPGERFRAFKAETSMEHWGMKDVEEEVTDKHLEEHTLGEHLALAFTGPDGEGTLGIFDVLKIDDAGKPVTLVFASGDLSLPVKLEPGSAYVYGDVLRLLYDQNQEKMDEVAGKALKSHALPEPHPLWLPALEKKHVELAQDPTADQCSMSSLILDIWLF